MMPASIRLCHSRGRECYDRKRAESQSQGTKSHVCLAPDGRTHSSEDGSQAGECYELDDLSHLTWSEGRPGVEVWDWSSTVACAAFKSDIVVVQGIAGCHIIET